MLSKNYAKLIPNLTKKKYRQKYNLFIVEGRKSVEELLKSEWEVKVLFVTEDKNINFKGEIVVVSAQEMRIISALSTPSDVLALAVLPKELSVLKTNGLRLVLAKINDPGNLGTIMRTADWFGLDQLICEKGSVDVFNPKTIQASMGSFLRVSVHYLEQEEIIFGSGACVGTYMDGESVYTKNDLPNAPFLVMGNEANGIPKAWENKITHRLGIPSLSHTPVESLNVATATAIFLSEFARQNKL